MTMMNFPFDSPPLRLDYAKPPSLPARPLASIGMAVTGVFAGAFVGASTNAINGLVSPTYYVTILYWDYAPDVWRRAVVQGVLEGLVVGTVLSTLFTATVAIVTRASCPYGLALRSLLGTLVGVYGCWDLGGLIAVAWASIDSEFYRNTFSFISLPRSRGQLLRFAWVGGSICGAEFGGLLPLVIGLVVFRGRWKRKMARAVHGQGARNEE